MNDDVDDWMAPDAVPSQPQPAADDWVTPKTDVPIGPSAYDTSNIVANLRNTVTNRATMLPLADYASGETKLAWPGALYEPYAAMNRMWQGAANARTGATSDDGTMPYYGGAAPAVGGEGPNPGDSSALAMNTIGMGRVFGKQPAGSIGSSGGGPPKNAVAKALDMARGAAEPIEHEAPTEWHDWPETLSERAAEPRDIESEQQAIRRAAAKNRNVVPSPLEAPADQFTKAVGQFEDDLISHGVAPEDRATQISERFGFPVDPADYTAGRSWWRDNVIKPRAWTSEITDALGGADYRKLNDTQAAARLSEDFGLDVSPKAVQKARYRYGIEAGATRGSGAKNVTWTQDILDALGSDEFAGLSHQDAAKKMADDYGLVTTPNAVKQRRYNMRKAKPSDPTFAIGPNDLEESINERLQNANAGQPAQGGEAKAGRGPPTAEGQRATPQPDAARGAASGSSGRAPVGAVERQKLDVGVPGHYAVTVPDRPTIRGERQQHYFLYKDGSAAPSATASDRTALNIMNNTNNWAAKAHLVERAPGDWEAIGFQIRKNRLGEGLEGNLGNAIENHVGSRVRFADDMMQRQRLNLGVPDHFAVSVPGRDTVRGERQRYYYVYRDGAAVPSDAASDKAALNIMSNTNNWAARAHMIERAPGDWETVGLDVRKNRQGNALDQALLEAIESHVGGGIRPGETLSEDAYRYWSNHNPEAVGDHIPVGGEYMTVEQARRSRSMLGSIRDTATSPKEAAAASREIAMIDEALQDKGLPLFGAGPLADRVNLMTTMLNMRPSVSMPSNFIQTIRGLIGPMETIVPDGHRMGVAARFERLKEPIRTASGEVADGAIEFANADGSTFRVLAPLSQLLRIRALHDPNTGNIGLVRLDLARYVDKSAGTGTDRATGQIDPVARGLRGEFLHEMVHLLADSGRLDSVWKILVDKANGLGILDSDFRTFLQAVGNSEYTKAPHGVRTRDIYDDWYRMRQDRDAKIDQESVAHMMELYHHGQLGEIELGDVKSILDGIIHGDYSKLPGKQTPGELAAAGSAR